MAKCVNAFGNFPKKFFLIFGFERYLSRQHDEQKDAACPYVGVRPQIAPLTDDLWTHVARSAAKNLKFLARDTCEAEVNNFDLVGLRVVHNVLSF